MDFVKFHLDRVVDYLVQPVYEDQRVVSWPLLDWKLASGIAALYIFSIVSGARFMEKRQPLQMKTFVACHNAFLFLLSLYMCVETCLQAYVNFDWADKFKLWCNPVEAGPDFTVSGKRLATIIWVHYISKAYEFVDTLVMVAKKNTRQITFLHVYHHATTFFPVWWAVVRFGPGGEAWFPAAYNSLIHVFMYGYYFAANFGYKAGLFKPFITLMQMLQFCMYIAQSCWHLFITDCARPRLNSVMLLFQSTLFLGLFSDFFVRTYLFPKKFKAGKGTVTNGSAVINSITNGTAALGSDANGSAVDGSVVNSSAVNGSAVNSSAVNGSVVNGKHVKAE